MEDIDKSGPRFDKFGSTSTTELRPKLPEDEDEEDKKDMPPTIVMVKLISVMTFRKLIRNPNTYSSIVGVVWSLLAFRYTGVLQKYISVKCSFRFLEDLMLQPECRYKANNHLFIFISLNCSSSFPWDCAGGISKCHLYCTTLCTSCLMLVLGWPCSVLVSISATALCKIKEKLFHYLHTHY